MKKLKYAAKQCGWLMNLANFFKKREKDAVLLIEDEAEYEKALQEIIEHVSCRSLVSYKEEYVRSVALHLATEVSAFEMSQSSAGSTIVDILQDLANQLRWRTEEHLSMVFFQRLRANRTGNLSFRR